MNGSYTFNFSPPISSFKVNVETLDNYNGRLEELVVYINGSFYPLASAGSPAPCWDPLILTPYGTLTADPVFFWGSAQDIEVSGNISTLTIECNVISGEPDGFAFSLHMCCDCCEVCTSSAGQIASALLRPCISEAATVPPATQTNLDSDDILQYVLFSDANNPIGSIIATNSDPSFSFNPSTMVAGTSYYIAAMVGDGLNGGIDPNDACISTSNQVTVEWQPKPTVTLSAIEQCLTPSSCYDIGLQFTGSPPFQLGGEAVSGGNVITTFSGTYTTLLSDVNICLPFSTPIGPINVNVTSLSDAYCNCN